MLNAGLAALAWTLTVLPAPYKDAPAPAAPPARPAEWRIDASHTLIWDGRPYLPVGRRIAGTVAEVEAAAEAGVQDVVVELPADGAGWGPVLEALERRRLRYLVALASAAPACRGVVVEPEGYRLPGIDRARRVDVRLPGAERALLLLAAQRDGSVNQSLVVAVRDGFLSADVDPGNDLEHVLLAYPVQTDLRTPDWWEGFDRHRDDLLGSLRRHRPGPGLRGLVDPMGRLVRFPSGDTRVVPVGEAFRLELESHLRQRYASIPNAARAWGIPAPDFTSFAAMARLVPLWSESRGIGWYWDPDSGRLYQADGRRGTAWNDIQEVIGRAAARRYARLAESIRQFWNVPIVQEWRGWSGPYANEAVELDGIAVTAAAPSPAAMAEAVGPAAGTAADRRRTQWLVATDLGSDPATWPERIADSAALGVRAWFARGAAPADAWTRAVAAATTPVLGEPTRFLRYPEAATEPVQTVNLGGFWLFPSSTPGSRIDYGTQYAGFRRDDAGGPVTVLWSTAGPRRVVLRVGDPSRVTATLMDGSPVPDARPVRRGIQLTLGEQPIVVRTGDDIPVPEDAFVEAGAQVQAMVALAERRLPTAAEEGVLMRDRLSQFESAPGTAFLALRQQARRLAIALGDYIWIEAEGTRNHSFSEVGAAPGASQNAVLRLASRLGAAEAAFSATYRVLPRRAGRHTVWVAARFGDDEARRRLSVRAAGQSAVVESGPVNRYASGLAWYRVGSLELPAAAFDLELAVGAAGTAVELDVDAVVLTTEDWRPEGAFPPLPPLPAPTRR